MWDALRSALCCRWEMRTGRREISVDMVCTLLARCFKASSTVRSNLTIDFSRYIEIGIAFQYLFWSTGQFQDGSEPSV